MAGPETIVDDATRIAATATRTRYDRVSIVLHWLTALLVLVQFALAETWGWFPRPTHHVMVTLHMSFGILLGLVVVVRIVWRLLPGHQVAPASTGWDEKIAKIAQYLLYLLLLAQTALGYLLRWSGGESMSLFGLQIPSPIAPMSKAEHHVLGDRHSLVGWAIVVLALGHAGAALYHHFVLRDRVLARMLPERAIDAG